MIRRASLRAATAGLVGCVVIGLWWATVAPLAAVRTGVASFDDVVGLAAAASCWTLLAWVVLALAVTALGSVPGKVGRLAAEVAVRLVPATIRRTTQFALGLAVAAGPVAFASSASAAPLVTGVIATVDHSDTVSDVMVLPDVGRPAWNVSASTTVHTQAEDAGSHRRQATTVVVRPGDCLWTIAATALGPSASNAEIAAEWPRWYAANRHVIGADPDLLLPGTPLRIPPATR